MYIESHMGGRRYGGWRTNDAEITVSVTTDAGKRGVRVALTFDGANQQGGALVVSDKTARWLAHAILGVTERVAHIAEVRVVDDDPHPDTSSSKRL